MTNAKTCVMCGVTDATLMLGILTIGSLVIKVDIFASLSFSMPIAFVAGWRGGADAARLLAGDMSWCRPGLEGFALGLLLLPAIHFIGFVQAARAAGSALPTFRDPFGVWLGYLSMLTGWSLMFGIAGGAVGLGISGMNRVILKMVQANIG